jgi:amino acid permease
MLIEVGSQLERRVRHPDGGDSSVEKIVQHEAAQRDEIVSETSGGSRKHHRLPRWIGAIPKCVLGFDFSLLLYFFAGITNVDWSNPLSVALGFAFVLAGMVTVLSYGFLSFTGHRLRSHKNHTGTIHREDVDGITGATFVIAIVVIAVLAVLMFVRIRTEVLYALGGQAQSTALVIAVVVSAVNAVANFLVIAIHAFNGSDQTARLDKLSAAIRGPIARVNRLRAQAAKVVNL